jgi:transcriptional regulator with XRE-family HTH domain
LRAELEISQGEFAARLGVRQAYVSALECGSKLPRDAELVRKIADELSLTAEQAAMLNRAGETADD